MTSWQVGDSLRFYLVTRKTGNMQTHTRTRTQTHTEAVPWLLDGGACSCICLVLVCPIHPLQVGIVGNDWKKFRDPDRPCASIAIPVMSGVRVGGVEAIIHCDWWMPNDNIYIYICNIMQGR